MPLLSPALALSPVANASETSADELYCEKRKLGYWFYCTKPKPPETETLPTEPKASASEQLDKVTKELRELKAKAILEPTRENVIAYIRFQREQLDRASLFSDVWQRAIWQQPDLDYTLERPVSTLAKRQWQDARSASRDMADGKSRKALRVILFLRAKLRRLRGHVANRKISL